MQSLPKEQIRDINVVIATDIIQRVLDDIANVIQDMQHAALVNTVFSLATGDS
ncbi:MAG: hypothetical protein ACTXOO_02775 [Sodalis sp. (in: enterobacteria)]